MHTPIIALGLDDKRQRLMAKAFQLYGDCDYRLDNTVTAPSLILVNLDHPKIEAILQKCEQSLPHVPLVGLTTRALSSKPANILCEPVRLEELFNGIQHTLKSPDQYTVPSLRQALLALKPTTKGQATTAAQSHETADRKEPPPLKVSYFNPNTGLLGLTKTAYEKRQDLIFFNGERPLFALYTNQGQAILLQPLKGLQEACLQESKNIRTVTIQPEFAIPQQPVLKIQQLLWQLAIWSAQGRLIEDITPDSPIYIKSWPNLTRLTKIPNAYKISALLTRSPMSLRTLHQKMGLPIGSICNYIAAVYAISLYEDPIVKSTLTEETEKFEIEIPIPAAANKDKKNLFARLLNKLSNH